MHCLLVRRVCHATASLFFSLQMNYPLSGNSCFLYALDCTNNRLSRNVDHILPVNQLHKMIVALITPADQPKSVRDRCVIELFFFCSTWFFGCYECPVIDIGWTVWTLCAFWVLTLVNDAQPNRVV